MDENKIHAINYKDILILIGLWYFIYLADLLLQQFAFSHSPFLTDLFRYLFLVAGRFLYATLFIFYFISFYSLTYGELGFKFSPFRNKLKTAFFALLPLAAGTIFAINIPLSFNDLSSRFQPLYQLETPQTFVISLFPLLLLSFSNLIVAGSEQLILNSLLFSTLKTRIPNILAAATASIVFSFLSPVCNPTTLYIRFLIAVISIYFYQKTASSIITPTIFQAGFYSLYTVYIYGWIII